MCSEMKLNVTKNTQLLKLIVRAIEKGVGEDVKEFMRTSDMATYNSIRMVRSDKINTNIRNSVASNTVQLKYFKRYGWTGCILIDRENKTTYTICSEKTLQSIPRKVGRNIPHYLQTLLYVENSSVVPQQMSLSEFMPEMKQMSLFDDEVYFEDYKSIMDEDVSFDDGYVHLVITYEAENCEIKSITLRLLDKDFQNAQAHSLTSFLQPDFSVLTAEYDRASNKDAHSLVSVKVGLKGNSEVEANSNNQISTKVLLEEKRRD